MLMGVYIVESILRAIVCSNFTAKALLLKTGDKQKVFRFQLFYYIFMMGSLITLGCFTFVTDNYELSCEKNVYSFHWFILGFIDFLQSVFITVSSIYLVKRMQSVLSKEEQQVA